VALTLSSFFVLADGALTHLKDFAAIALPPTPAPFIFPQWSFSFLKALSVFLYSGTVPPFPSSWSMHRQDFFKNGPGSSVEVVPSPLLSFLFLISFFFFFFVQSLRFFLPTELLTSRFYPGTRCNPRQSVFRLVRNRFSARGAWPFFFRLSVFFNF